MVAIDIAVLIIGMAMLLYGSDRLVDGASHLAHRFGVHPILVGMTILSIGTSIPEIATSITSYVIGSGDIAMGNIIGSDLVQITLILGVVAFIRPLHGKRKEILFYGITMLFAVLLALYTVRDGVIDRYDGLVLVIAYGLFLAHIIGNAHIRKHPFKKKHDKKSHHLAIIMIASLILVIVGSRMMVMGAINVAHFFALPEFIISFFIIGLGTSLPELVISGVAAFRKQYGMSVGNLLGSNITDPTLSLGLGALFTSGVAIAPVASFSVIYLLIAIIVAISLFAARKKLTRAHGALLVLMYVASYFFI